MEDAVAWAASQTKLSRTRIQQFRSISEHWDLVGGCNSISAALKMIKPKSKSKPMKAPEKKSAKPMADDPLPEALAGDGFDVLFSKLSDLLLQAVECAKPAERIRLNGLLKLHITE